MYVQLHPGFKQDLPPSPLRKQFLCLANIFIYVSGIVSNPSLISSETENVQPQNEVIQVMNSSTDLSPCYNFAWSQDELSLLPCDMIASLETTLPYPNTTSSTTATLEVATGTKTE